MYMLCVGNNNNDFSFIRELTIFHPVTRLMCTTVNPAMFEIEARETVQVYIVVLL